MLATPSDWPDYSDVAVPSNAESLLRAASSAVIGECGWSIARETVELAEFDGDGGRVLMLPTMHLVSVEQVLVDDDPVSDYRISRRGMLSRPTGWPEGFGRIHVSYTHGLETVPSDIVALVVGLAARSAEIPVGVSMEMADRLQVRYETDQAGAPQLSEHDRRALAPWRLP